MSRARHWRKQPYGTLQCLSPSYFRPKCHLRVKVHLVRYRPVFWIHFGGPGDSYLESLTGVSIYYSRKGLYSLEFHYAATYDLTGAFRLGRCASTDLKIRHFPIDGASGEIIDSIEVTLSVIIHKRLIFP